MPLAAAFALGAVVSPTDPLAAGLIMRNQDVPRQLVSAVEGEGLFNDATALVAYKVAVAAVVTLREHAVARDLPGEDVGCVRYAGDHAHPSFADRRLVRERESRFLFQEVEGRLQGDDVAEAQ